MQTQHESLHSSRLEALQARHAALQNQIHEEEKHAALSDELLRRLKREKLKLKDEIEKVRRRA